MNLPLAKGKAGDFLSRHFMEAALLSAALACPVAVATPVQAQSGPQPQQSPLAQSYPARPALYQGNMPFYAEDPAEDENSGDQPAAKPAPVTIDFTPLPSGMENVRGTKVSQFMREIEARANATNPKYRVVIFDDDSINLRNTNNVKTFRNRLYEVLNDRKVSLRWNVKSDVFDALGGFRGPQNRVPQAMRIDPQTYSESRNPLDANVNQTNVCLVIPTNANASSRNLVNAWIGNKTFATKAEAKLNPGPYALILRTTWHETWHCLDPYFQQEGYYIRGDSALNNAARIHRAETFAEVASVLTMAATHPHMAQFMADFRAISADYEARNHMPGTRPSDDNYYAGVTYDFSRALDLAAQHIKTVGHDVVAQYSLEDIGRHAREITLQGAFTKDELQQRAQMLAAGAPESSRVQQAKARLMQDTGLPIGPRTGPGLNMREEQANQAERFLKQMPAAQQQEFKRVVAEYRAAAVAAGKLPEQGLIQLIDDWREKVQTEQNGYEAYEEKLYVLSLMLAYGYLEEERAAPQPAQMPQSVPQSGPQSVPQP